MRIYIIGNDGITLCREPPATVNKGDVAVASREELHAARLSGKRLLALWSALPGVEKQTRVGDRDRLISDDNGGHLEYDSWRGDDYFAAPPTFRCRGLSHWISG